MADPPLPKLLVSKEHAEQKIDEQINRGRHIASMLAPPQAVSLRTATTEGEKWAKFTIDLLKGLVTDLSIDREFGDAVFRRFSDDPITEFYEWMDKRICRLDSILQRLPLFRLPAKHELIDGLSSPPNLSTEGSTRPRIKIFISWSGDLSHGIALTLREWLPIVLHFVEPWVSSEDIRKGTRWSPELTSELERTHSGIICLVHDNLTAPWLMFEAGALSKSVVKSARIHPFLVGIKQGDLPGPLAQFQATRYSKDDMRKLIQALNTEAEDAALSPTKVSQVFDVCWPDLERRIAAVLEDSPKNTIEKESGSRETERDLTTEELAILRRVADSRRTYPKTLEEDTSLHWQHIQHIMESLEALGLLSPTYNTIHGTGWSVSKEGRDFLISKRLI